MSAGFGVGEGESAIKVSSNAEERFFLGVPLRNVGLMVDFTGLAFPRLAFGLAFLGLAFGVAFRGLAFGLAFRGLAFGLPFRGLAFVGLPGWPLSPAGVGIAFCEFARLKVDRLGLSLSATGFLFVERPRGLA